MTCNVFGGTLNTTLLYFPMSVTGPRVMQTVCHCAGEADDSFVLGERQTLVT